MVWLLSVLTASALLLGSGCTLGGVPSGAMDHRVASDSSSGQAVTFDRGSMARSFQATEGGGIEQVVARDPVDALQVDRARAYLRGEAEAFQQGRYEDPARSHGMEMPGSKELEGGYSRVQTSYADLPNGGQLTYAGPDPVLVQAPQSVSSYV
jgi:hypothetical protein